MFWNHYDPLWTNVLAQLNEFYDESLTVYSTEIEFDAIKSQALKEYDLPVNYGNFLDKIIPFIENQCSDINTSEKEASSNSKGSQSIKLSESIRKLELTDKTDRVVEENCTEPKKLKVMLRTNSFEIEIEDGKSLFVFNLCPINSIYHVLSVLELNFEAIRKTKRSDFFDVVISNSNDRGEIYSKIYNVIRDNNLGVINSNGLNCETYLANVMKKLFPMIIEVECVDCHLLKEYR
jgi:hypothetical protein